MLGRLQMSIDECIEAYTSLMEKVFKNPGWSPFGLFGTIRSRFDSKKLETAIKEVILKHGASGTDLLNDGVDRTCKVFVCTVASETKHVVRLRSYSTHLPDIPATTILQAALATSAATSFFDPVKIEKRKFVDGGIAANNPVEQVRNEAANVWCDDTRELKPLVKCFISIGTGVPGIGAIGKHLVTFTGTLIDLATETERTEEGFAGDWQKHLADKRYFRFNVSQGLQNIGLAEYNEQGPIAAATEAYLLQTPQKLQVKDCVETLWPKKRMRTHFHVPFPRDGHFVCREKVMDQIDQTCSIPMSRVALFGAGGMGKTQLAIEYSYRLRDKQHMKQIFWVHASNLDRFHQSFREIADRLNIPGRDIGGVNVLELVRQWLSDERNGQWVLILDNLDDSQLLDKAKRAGTHALDENKSLTLREYLPTSQNGSILVTTRTRGAAVELVEPENIIEIGQMGLAESVELLTNKLRSADNNEILITELASALDFIPLAMVQAATYIYERAPRYSVEKYLEKFRKNDSEKMQLLYRQGGHLRRDWEANSSILATWQISFRHIKQTRPSAARLLSLMSFFDRQQIPDFLLQTPQATPHEDDDMQVPAENNEFAWVTGFSSLSDSSDELEDDILMLRNFSFLTADNDGLTFTMHRLVQLATQQWLCLCGEHKLWMEKSVEHLCVHFPKGVYDSWDKCKLLFPHAKFATDRPPFGQDSLKTWATLLESAARYAWEIGNYADAETMLSKAIEVRLNHMDLEVEVKEALVAFSLIIKVYDRQGRWNEAEDVALPLIHCRKHLLGETHPDTLMSLSQLAVIYLHQGRWQESEEIGIQVLDARRKMLRDMHPDTLLSESHLGLVYSHQGRWEEAEQIHRRVMMAHAAILGPEDPDTLTSAGFLTSAYGEQGRWEEAEEVGKYALNTCNDVLGPEHPDTLDIMETMASIYMGQENWNAAEELYVQVTELRRKVLSDDHPQTLTSEGNIAFLYANMGRYNEAEEINMRVMEALKKVCGPEHRRTLASMANLAHIWKNQSHYLKAAEFLDECLQLHERVLGSEDPDTQAICETLMEWENEAEGPFAATSTHGQLED
ncbi:hypothetical protein N7530_006358 [Penicillium desertorum]|uniref:PNPLA domain-containing protein n=1 Tax=Penicillium desertorum TaxID=1303715 RepID=A0A9X0BMI9_9EURO|nr:hypothetical protein N7530_006358 [Penicillium desertorum]